MEENNQEQKTVEDEMNEEIVKENNPSGESTESKDDYVDLTNTEVQEEKKFQDELNNQINEDVPNIEPKESTKEKPIIPNETSNVIKDQDLILLQYQCEDKDCEFKFYINNLDADIGEKFKCFRCGKKTMKKRRLFDTTIKQFKDYVEEK